MKKAFFLEKPEGTDGRGSSLHFTLQELLIVVAVIALLIGMLLPALQSARKTAQGSLCTGNFKQIGVSHGQYMNDYNGYIVPKGAFPEGAATNDIYKRNAIHLLLPYVTTVNPADDYMTGIKYNWLQMNSALAKRLKISLWKCASCPATPCITGSCYAINPKLMQNENIPFWNSFNTPSKKNTQIRKNPVLFMDDYSRMIGAEHRSVTTVYVTTADTVNNLLPIAASVAPHPGVTWNHLMFDGSARRMMPYAAKQTNAFDY